MTSTTYPEHVVAVVNAKAISGYPYLVAAVYDLATRKRDGEPVYRRSDATYAQPHRSHRLAVADAERIAAEHGWPFWERTRHDMTAAEALSRHADDNERSH